MPATLPEKVYYKLPTTLQNFVFSVYGWNIARRRYSRFFDKYLRELKQSEWWSEDELRNHQNAQLRHLIRHAYDTTVFYRHYYDDHEIDISSIQTIDDLEKLPILTKALARENQKDLISSVFNKRRLSKLLTSGTTGTPLEIYQSPEGVAYQWAVWWRHNARFGINRRDRYLTFGARIPIDQSQQVPPYWRHDYANNRAYLSTYHISPTTTKDIVDYLNDTNFDFFAGYPSAMYVLACWMEEQGLRLYNRPKRIITGSDALLPHHAEVLSRVFGAPITEHYGMAEFAGTLSKCEQGNFHVDAECCHVETIGKDGSEFDSLVLTGWGNLAMPFIRYAVGDYGRKNEGLCVCGRNSPTLTSIDGRLEDYVVTPDGRKLIGMNQVFEYAKNAREIQIFQRTSEEVEFRIVPNHGFGDADKNALEREFTRRAGSNMRIKFSLVDRLERSSTGKLKAVISEVDT